MLAVCSASTNLANAKPASDCRVGRMVCIRLAGNTCAKGDCGSFVNCGKIHVMSDFAMLQPCLFHYQLLNLPSWRHDNAVTSAMYQQAGTITKNEQNCKQSLWFLSTCKSNLDAKFLIHKVLQFGKAVIHMRLEWHQTLWGLCTVNIQATFQQLQLKQRYRNIKDAHAVLSTRRWRAFSHHVAPSTWRWRAFSHHVALSTWRSRAFSHHVALSTWRSRAFSHHWQLNNQKLPVRVWSSSACSPGWPFSAQDDPPNTALYRTTAKWNGNVSFYPEHAQTYSKRQCVGHGFFVCLCNRVDCWGWVSNPGPFAFKGSTLLVHTPPAQCPSVTVTCRNSSSHLIFCNATVYSCINHSIQHHAQWVNPQCWVRLVLVNQWLNLLVGLL